MEMPEKRIENTRNGNILFPGIFLFLLAVSMPARLFLCMDQYRNEVLFSHTALAGIALAFTLFSLPEKYVKNCSFLFCKSFFIPFTLLFLPLFSALFAGNFRKILPKVFAWSGGIILFFSVIGILLLPQHYYRILFGLPGNRNWNASFILALLPFLLYELYKFFREKKHLSVWKTLFLLLIPAAGSIYFLYHTASLGSLVSICALFCCTILFLLPEKWRKITFIALFSAGLFAIVFLVIFFDKIEPVMGKAGSMGERMELIKSSGNALLKDIPLAGNNFASIEQALSTNRSEEYFKLLNPAIRSPHPHNHFLYIFMGWGLPCGLILWACMLVIFPVIKSLFLLAEEKGNITEKLLFFSLISLLAHSQVDLIMEIWPCGAIALLLLGLCWEKSFRRKETKEICFPEKGKILCRYFAIFILLFPLFLAARQAYIFYAKEVLFHSGKQDKHKWDLLTENIACIYPAHTVLLYDLMLSALQRNEPEKALFLSDHIVKGPIPDYARIHYARGQIFLMLGRIDESLSEYALDGEKFPLAVLPLYNMIRIAERNNRKHLISPLQQELSRRIGILKITQQEFMSILADPGKELTPWGCVKDSPDKTGSVFANWQKRFAEK